MATQTTSTSTSVRSAQAPARKLCNCIQGYLIHSWSASFILMSDRATVWLASVRGRQGFLGLVNHVSSIKVEYIDMGIIIGTRFRHSNSRASDEWRDCQIKRPGGDHILATCLFPRLCLLVTSSKAPVDTTVPLYAETACVWKINSLEHWKAPLFHTKDMQHKSSEKQVTKILHSSANDSMPSTIILCCIWSLKQGNCLLCCVRGSGTAMQETQAT